MDNVQSEDTSSYWRKVLGLDKPCMDDITKKCDRHLKLLRPPLRALASLLFENLFSLDSAGLENLPKNAPFIIASNHLSSLDFPAIFLSLPTEYKKNICVVYKSFFDKVPFARMFIKSFVPSFSVNATGDFLSAMSFAAAALMAGRILFIAPEGTRSQGEMLPFKVGVGALAVETMVPVVPVFISGSDKALPRGSFIPRKSPIKVVFGKAIDPSGYLEKKKASPAYDVYKEFTEEIRGSIFNLKERSK